MATPALSKLTHHQATSYFRQLNRYILKQIKANPGKKLNDMDLKLDKFKFNPKRPG